MARIPCLSAAAAPAAPARRRGRAGAAGFTLIELMVSIALGMIIMVALVGVYVNVSRTNTEMAKTNGVIESGRFAIDLLQEDIQHAGYWGGFVPSWDDLTLTTTPTDNLVAAAPDPCLAVASWTADYKNLMVGLPVQAFSMTTAGVPSGLAGCSTIIRDRKANTDVLVVRRAEFCVPGSANCEAENAARVYFQPSFCPTGTPALAGAAGDASSFVLGTSGFTMRQRTCAGALAPKRKFVSSIYYVRTWSSVSGDGIPTLVRASFNLGGTAGTAGFESAVALIEGIEHFVVDLGVDAESRCGAGTPINYAVAPVKNKWNQATGTCSLSTTATENTLPTNRGDGVPENYRRCPEAGCTVDQLRNVVAAKVYLLARSRDESSSGAEGKSYTLGSVAGSNLAVAASTDKYRRHLFHSTVRLNNVSGRREAP